MKKSALKESRSINGVWMLDNTLERRYYTSDLALATAIYGGYGILNLRDRFQTDVTLEWYGKAGYVDATKFADTAFPSRYPYESDNGIPGFDPTLNARYEAADDAGKKLIRKNADKLHKQDLLDFVEKLDEFRQLAIEWAR